MDNSFTIHFCVLVAHIEIKKGRTFHNGLPPIDNYLILAKKSRMFFVTYLIYKYNFKKQSTI